MRSRLRLLLIVVLMVGGSLLCSGGMWIHAKALLAQVLLRQAWEQTLTHGQPVKPWPWADTWPVARLQAPKYGQDLIVLAGQVGATLAFGPGMLADGVGPGKPGTCILAGHRDTSFSFLQQVQPDDVFVLEGGNGNQWKYKVSSTTVRPAEDLYLAHLSVSRLALVTCYPFNAVLPGTPQRYVVLAERIKPFIDPRKQLNPNYFAIGELLTHKDSSVTRRYASFLPEARQKAATRAAEILTDHTKSEQPEQKIVNLEKTNQLKNSR